MIKFEEFIMKTSATIKLGLGIAAVLGLSACAGGMSGGTTSGSGQSLVTQFPVETAILNIYTKSRSESLVANIGNQTATADIKVTPKGNLRFNNKTVQGAEVNTINKVNGQVTDQSVAINYFILNPLTFYGFTDSKGQYSTATQTSAIPKMANVGASSLLIKEDVYSDNSMRQKVGTYHQSWSLSRDSNTTAWFCIDTTDNLLASQPREGTSSECYKINARGDILASKVTLTPPSGNINNAIVFNSR